MDRKFLLLRRPVLRWRGAPRRFGGRVCRLELARVHLVVWMVLKVPSHLRDCHFADVPSTSLLIHLLQVEGGAAERKSRQRLQVPL